MARPDTPFELAGGAAFTSVTDEAAFLQQLAADSGRVTVVQAGTSNGGRPVRLVGVGLTPPTVAGSAASGEAVLYIGGQHGNEIAGREAMLTMMRDLAYGTDADTLALLAARPVWFLPTANPDGTARDRRFNDADADTNRDHLLLAHEGRIMQQAITDLNPVFVLDAHEMEGAVTDELRLQTCLAPTADAGLLAASNVMLDDLIAHALGQGLIAGPWPGATSPDELWRRATNPHIMRNTIGMRHAVSILTETRCAPGDAPQWRHDIQLDVFRRCTLHFAGLSEVIDAAKTRSAETVLTPIDLRNGHVISPAPDAYRLTAPQVASLAVQLQMFGIEHDDGLVPMRQAAQPLLAPMLDPKSDHKLVSAERVYSGDGVSVRLDGSWVPAARRALAV